MATPSPLESRPLYAVQRDALVDEAAALECARRYVDRVSTTTAHSDRHRVKLTNSFLAGLRGEPNAYDRRHGGNFAAPYRRAYLTGAALRRELTQS